MDDGSATKIVWTIVFLEDDFAMMDALCEKAAVATSATDAAIIPARVCAMKMNCHVHDVVQAKIHHTDTRPSAIAVPKSPPGPKHAYSTPPACSAKMTPQMEKVHPTGVIGVVYLSDISAFVGMLKKPAWLETFTAMKSTYATTNITRCATGSLPDFLFKTSTDDPDADESS